jgi:hypothetical protein
MQEAKSSDHKLTKAMLMTYSHADLGPAGALQLGWVCQAPAVID